MVTKTYRYYVEVDLEHTEGPVAPPSQINQLMVETFEEMVGPEQTFTLGDGSGYYMIAASRVEALDAASARRLIGPAKVGPATDFSGAAKAAGQKFTEELGRLTPDCPKPARRKWQPLELEGGTYRFGDVLQATITAPLEGQHDGKVRPCVWITEDKATGKHGVVGLTTKPYFDNGVEREPISWKGNVYTGQTYLWGGKVVWINPDQILQIMGHLNEPDLNKVMWQHRRELKNLKLEIAG